MLFKSTVVNLYFRLKSIERSRISDIKSLCQASV